MGGINKREHLIKTGQNLIWSKGYDLCSIKDITSAAGLPKGSFYHYFESKEKFAIEAMDEFITAHPEKIPDQIFNIETLTQLIDNRIKSIIKIQYAKECYMSVMCHAYSEQEEEFRHNIVAAINKSNESMKHLLAEMKNNGIIKSTINLAELEEFIDFSWRGARLKARILKSEEPLKVFKKYLIQFIQNN